jgi:transcriptional regulator with XRE-family HTH domain
MTTGEKIRAARKAKHMTMSQLAEMTGLSVPAISRYELGERTPRMDKLFVIANALEMEVGDLFWDVTLKPDTQPDTKPTIEQLIGTPAVLEQLAEECAELGQAALKLARKMRGENPTPKTQDELLENLTEEVADVLLCIEQVNLDACMIVHIKACKRARWRQRIEDMNHDN